MMEAAYVVIDFCMYLPCEEHSDIMMVGMTIIIWVDGLLPFAEAIQCIFRVVGDIQDRLEEGKYIYMNMWVYTEGPVFINTG